MKLFNSMATSILQQINTAIGANGCMNFFASTGNIPTTAILGTSSQVKFAASAISTFSTNAADPTGTQCTGVFAAMITGTCALTATAAYFAIFNTTATNPSLTNVLFTGSVATTGADLNFNTTVWSSGDNVNITSLNFIEPQGS